MRFVRHRTDQGPRLAVLDDEDVLIDLPPGPDLPALLDFELEVAAVVGRAGQDLTVDQAADHIAGFVVLNDFSARDVQFHEMRLRLGPAKGKDTATALGTVFVTADELSHRRSGTSYDLFLPPLRPGDVVTTTVELLGGTRNRIVPGVAPHEIRPGRLP
ncbi:fumarylacetoacetate hydrolase family protein [Pseudonocardia kunmingensis]|uniref:fumarylacetoacetate hydrolase family protein n=1 Tax=Pseudonocardia kunmingensis TaxID=630975 RepID=UPI00114F5EA0